jgi:hypothetical protein
MTIDQFRKLNACAEAEEKFGGAPATYAFSLGGIVLELVDLGYLVATKGGPNGIIGLSVTLAGRLALVQ